MPYWPPRTVRSLAEPPGWGTHGLRLPHSLVLVLCPPADTMLCSLPGALLNLSSVPLISFTCQSTKMGAEGLKEMTSDTATKPLVVVKSKIYQNRKLNLVIASERLGSNSMVQPKPGAITYILAMAVWPLLAKQCTFNMIRTDYAVVCTSKEPGPIITPAFQPDDRFSFPPCKHWKKRKKRRPDIL